VATSGDDLISACDLAGKILAQMKIAQTEEICPMPVEALARDLDLAEAPWHLSSREQKILESALESLAGAKVRIGHVYYDYTPANLLFENDQLSLVDPSDLLRQGVLLWDFSCFRSSMRRHLWRFSLRRPLDRRRAMIKEAIALFQRSYLGNFDKRYPEPALFAAATLLFELQRTAVLLTRCRRGRSLWRDRGCRSPATGRSAILWPTEFRCLCWKWKSGGSSCNSLANCPDNGALRRSPACSWSRRIL
jgi:hypothetical protein